MTDDSTPNTEEQTTEAPNTRSFARAALSFLSALKVPALAVFSAFVCGAVLIVFTNPDCLYAWARFFNDPVRALSLSWNATFDAYRALLVGAVGSKYAISETITRAGPLIFAGLSVAFAFKAGLFNIGAAGQILMGSAAAAYVGFTYELPAYIHLPLALLAGFAGGALWGGIAGVLRATTGAHEVISTIMLNFIALNLLNFLLTTTAFRPEGDLNLRSYTVNETAMLPKFNDAYRADWGFVLALVAVVVVWWVLQRSTAGFSFKALGANASAARYAGMGAVFLMISAMGIAGGLAGLAGTAVVLGITPQLTATGLPPLGFDAIAVALLGRSNPVGVLFAALLFGGLQAGALTMQVQTETPTDIVTVIQALIVMFVAAPGLVRGIYRINTQATVAPALTTNWGKS
jgi:simple sugar transport system permease protein